MVIKKIQKLAKNAKKKYNKLIDDQVSSGKDKVAAKDIAKAHGAERRYVHIAMPDIAKAVLITIGLLVAVWALYQIRDIILIFFVSLFFAAALDPTVDKLEEKYKIPRGVSVVMIFIILLTLLGIFISNFIPILARELIELARQAQELISNLVHGDVAVPAYLEWVNPMIERTFGGVDSAPFTTALENNLQQAGQQLGKFAGDALNAFVAISNGIANAILVLLLTYFMTVDEHLIDKFLHSVFPSKYGKYITQKTEAIKWKVGQWLRGQIALMIVVGLFTYIGLVILGVEYSFTLAMFAGITELIPVIGPLIGWVAAIPIAANDSGMMVLWVSVLYFIVQRVENNLLVPLIMKKATGLHPLIVIFAMLVGFKFMGVIGVILSVPLAAAIGIFLNDYLAKDR